MAELKECVNLNNEGLQALLKRVYAYQSQVIVRLDGSITLGMFELIDLSEFLTVQGYSQITLVSKSYGYELEVPLTIER